MHTHTHTMTGLDGGNPAAFLAALGILRIVPDARLAWAKGAGYVAVIETDATLDELCDLIAAADLPPEIAPDNPWYLVRSAASGGPSGGERWLAIVAAIREHITPQIVRRDLTEMWRYLDDGKGVNLRLDPHGVNGPYALEWAEPAKNPHGVCHGAQWLAAHGVAALGGVLSPAFGAEKGRPIGWQENEFCWPIWTPPLSMDVIRTMIALRGSAEWSGGGTGVIDWYTSSRQRSLSGPGPSPMQMSIGMGAAWTA